ncbi:capsular exopolysaccharide family [Desulfacinum hydrothermale DSM 13146]|uniref:Capsular exopolysaccharide family n=1 Tax=Desulfacinum hydrothermale DSM 13146 TaxID=1121390 RepID=A0A1W1XSA6_9BACT|nr:CpsD/CapB family tyrosine-protein kinase [Desulfacinum hydrothermale]SMC26732.1 capsular exopolysaccharide family [Desulfacinum hydrothermale DSM 13146]
MSTLKKALERAKSERTGRGESPAPAPSAAPPLSPPESGAQPSPAPIYTRTRVIHVPPARLLANRVLAVTDDGHHSDAFKLLRTRVLQQTRLRGWNTLQVSGFGVGEGKSLVAANLAVAMARDTRQTTLLVDLDFRRPTLHRIFGLVGLTAGLEAYFAGSAPLEEIFVSPGIEKLTLLPTLQPMAHSAEIMGSPRMEALIRELKRRYDDRAIVFDTPAVNACPDPIIVSEYVDGLLLVARAGRTRKEAVAQSLDLVPRDKLLGIVMNDLPPGHLGRYGYA